MKHNFKYFACLLVAVLCFGQVWGEVVSGTTYTTDPKTPSVPANWTVNSYANDANYTKLASNTNYIQTDEFCQNGFTSIKIKARKFGGPSATQAVISVEWFENGGSSTVLATVSPTSTSLADYTLSELESVTGNKSGYIKISCKAASGGKGCGVSQVTITYTAGSCGGGTPTCVTPTFSPAAGSYEGTQNVTITSTTGATIYYTTDGSNPTTSGTKQTYSSPIAVSADMTIMAYATLANYDDSEVATAAYTITEGPDVVLDFTDNTEWQFPTSNTLNEGTFSDGTYTVKVKGEGSGKGYKFSSGKLLIGQNGAYLLLPEFANPIAKIVCPGVSGASSAVKWNVYDGETAVSTEVTGCTSDVTFEIDPQAANKQYKIKLNSAHNLQISHVKIYFGEAPAVVAPTISGETSFLNTTEVTISIPEGATVYYTTDGSTPSDASTPYSAPFTLNESATVKAIAKIGGDVSGVVEKAFTKVTPLTVAQARAAIDAGGDLSNKYVAGIISQIDSYNNTYNSITYWISDDGTTTDQLEVYSGLAGVVKTQFASVEDLAVGDDVTVNGTLKKYNSTYEFDKNNTIVAYKPIARLSWSESSYEADLSGSNTFPTLTKPDGITVSYSSSDPSKAEINSSTGVITLKAVGSTTITATFAGNATYKANSASYTLNVANSVVRGTITYNVDGGSEVEALEDQTALPDPLPTTTKAGKNFGGWFTDSQKTIAAVAGAAIEGDITLYAKWLDPYTVAEAKTVVGNNTTGIANQYVAGIISQIDSYNSTYHSITYWISADGTTTDQLEIYSGLIGNAATALGKEQFSAKTDLEVGDEVVVTGTLKKFNDIYEFDKNNTIYSFSRKASAGLVYATTAVNKVVGDAAFVNELTNPNSVDVTYATSDDQVAEVANDGTVTIIGAGSATISASFAGNATYKAAVVSYTLTVSATTDTRKEANGPAEFTATSGDLDPADIAYEAFKGGANNDPAIYNSGIRLYQISGSNTFGGFITLTAKAGCTIDEVQITTTSKYATTVAYSVDGNETLSESESVAKSGSYTTGKGLNVSSVNILNLGTGSDGRLEIASIKVYYTGEAATIDHYELGGTYQTAFMQDEDFNHTGLIVYAAYDALGENKVDITSMCTFSEPDMSTTGEKTIEITYNEAVVISYKINVAADSRKVAESPATFTTVSGDMTPNDITFAANQGGASTAPANYNNGIRLYQAPSASGIGGFITLKAKKGCTIDQVKITTTNSYATTVAYSVDGNENLLGSESVAKSSDYSTPSGLNVESVNIVNKGTGSNGRLEIASIKVWYKGDALSVDHYILGGTYETTFEQYGTFSYEGLTVTAAYDAGGTITEEVTGFTVEADLSTAGAAKANVMLNSVKIAEYDITVTASAKVDPELAYNPASVILTFGQSLTAPTFSNDHNVSPITYSSDKPAVATVDADGNIALAGGTGVAVITASFAGDDDYIDSEATFTITVNEPAEDLSGTWALVTDVEQLAAGKKVVIAYCGLEGNYLVAKTMGAQNTNNRAAVASSTKTTTDYTSLTLGLGTKVFTLVDAGDDKFAIKASNGKYLTSATSGTSNNLLEATDYDLDNAKWTISIEEGVASIVAAAGSKTVMQYNSGSTIFSCYGTASQKPVRIYMLQEDTPVVPEPDYTRDVTPGNYGTICLPNGGTIVGAILFQIAYYNEGEEQIIFEELEGNAMVAGRPYLFWPLVSQIEVFYTDNTGAAAGSWHGLHGSYSKELLPEDDGNYILYQNMYYLVNSTAYVGANRAYIKLGSGEDCAPTTDPGAAPGRRRIAMGVQGKDVATGISDIETGDQPIKVMIDGNLYIIRAGQMYDMTGSKVK